jgi:hypothetical protein
MKAHHHSFFGKKKPLKRAKKKTSRSQPNKH